MKRVQKSKAICALLLVLVMIIGLAACGKEDVSTKPTESEEQTQKKTEDASDTNQDLVPEKVSSEKITLSIMLPEQHAPVDKEHLFFTGIEELTNVRLDPIPVIFDNYSERMNVTLASGDLPDIMAYYTVSGIIDEYGPQGAFAVLDLEKMPNYKLKLSEVENAIELIKSPDGNIYRALEFNYMGVQNAALFARIDMIQKANLELPKAPYSIDELYQLMLELKNAYPDTYPILQFAPGQHWGSWAPLFQTRSGIYFNQSSGQYLDGRLTENFKDLLRFLNNAYKDGILNPEFPTITRQQFDEYLLTDITLFNIGSAAVGDVFTPQGLVRNPDYLFDTIEPPQYMGGDFWQESFHPLNMGAGYVVSNLSKNKDIAVRLLDWMYSEEGSIFNQWGKEGVTYEVVDGQMRLMDHIQTRVRAMEGIPDLKQLWHDYSIGRHGWYLERREDRHIEMDRGPLTRAGADMYAKYQVDPAPITPLMTEEQERIGELGGPINTYLEEQLMRVILGDLAVDEWDNVIEKAKEMGSDEIVKIYQKAYERAYK